MSVAVGGVWCDWGYHSFYVAMGGVCCDKGYHDPFQASGCASCAASVPVVGVASTKPSTVETKRRNGYER